jgi:hypothetical protein
LPRSPIGEVCDMSDEPRSRQMRRRLDDKPRRKKAKRSGNPVLLWALIGGGAVVILISLTVGLILLLTGNKESTSPSSPGNPSGGLFGNLSPAAPLEIKAETLTREMVASMMAPEGFRRKYSGSTLLIEGKVIGSKEGQGDYRVALEGHKDGGAMVTGIWCIFTGNEIAAARKLEHGATVRINCKLSPQTSNAKGVIVEGCRIVSPR